MIDLRSDTVTRPTQGMLEAMMKAPVGDDVFLEDPTIQALENKTAEIFGKEAGIFCPSGTMTNQIAIRLHTQPGSEVICHKEAHVYKYEGGGIMVNSSSSVRLIEGNRGRLKPEDIVPNINNPEDIHLPLTRLVCLEDTANRGGGAIYDTGDIKKISAICKEKNLPLHLDGARVFNALVENNCNPKEYGSWFDTISICFSKGLGTPIGSVLVGTKDHIYRARRIRKVLGGGMRQVGILGAAGLYALEHHIDRLKEDHRRASIIGKELIGLPFVDEVFPVETNIVVFRVKGVTVPELLQKLKDKGILAVAFGPDLVRMVTHLDFSEEQLDELISGIKQIK